MNITINKQKVGSIVGLVLLALWTFLTVMNFKSHDWAWGAVSLVLMVFESFTINRDWAWKPKAPEDNDKTKELKKGWKEDL